MQGIVARVFRGFIRDAYGTARWIEIMQEAGLPCLTRQWIFSGTWRVGPEALVVAARQLQTSEVSLLEDLGTYMVAHPNMEAFRRLLRYGGQNFESFLFSLRDLEGRARLILPDLHLPRLAVRESDEAVFMLEFQDDAGPFAAISVGVIRAMADDYGVLVLVDLEQEGSRPCVTVRLLSQDFAAGRQLELLGAVR